MPSIKCRVCSHEMHEEIDVMLANKVSYHQIQDAVRERDPTYYVPILSVISRHYKKHFLPMNVSTLVWRNGQLCFTDGTPLTPVSAIQFLEGVIALAARNLMDKPQNVTVANALTAVELLLKIRSGLDKLDDFESAWTDFIKSGKGKTTGRRKKRMTVEVTEEDEQVIDATLNGADDDENIVKYEGFNREP